MNLQSKFMYAIGGAFVVTFAIAQTIQLWNVDKEVTAIGNQVVDAMNASGQQTIEALQRREDAVMALTGRFLEDAVAASLERGEMDKFRRLVEDQKDVPGLLEFSLYNTDDTVGYSTRDAAMGRRLPQDVATRLTNRVEPLRIDAADRVQIYLPQVMNSDCVRCHREWVDRPTAGILFVEMSTETLMRAKADADASVDQAKTDITEALGQTQRSMVITSLSAAAVTLLVLGIVVALLIRSQLTRRFNRFLAAFEMFTSHGDLTSRVDDSAKDELGQLSQAFSAFTAKLAQTVRDIRELADRVNHQADGILDRSRTISAGADEQRGDLSAVATAVTEMAQSAN
nr:methyl-accepting chemotaxis protein [Gammaproteobacteria bacterium]